MKTTFAVLLGLVLTLSQVCADLYCYSCFSYESEQKCWENRRKVKCAWQNSPTTSSFDSCIKFEVKVKVVESINGDLKAIENKGYGMGCGRKKEDCFLQKCRNYWGLQGEILNGGCQVTCCNGTEATCRKPEQTPVKVAGNVEAYGEVGARSSLGMQYKSCEFTALIILVAGSMLFVM